jgi:NADH dehydrogenase FAD-containing subunit
MLDIDVASRPRVVIIGAGFGGLSAAKTRHQENATVMLASVTRVDTARREVLSGISAARTRSTLDLLTSSLRVLRSPVN